MRLGQTNRSLNKKAPLVRARLCIQKVGALFESITHLVPFVLDKSWAWGFSSKFSKLGTRALHLIKYIKYSKHVCWLPNKRGGLHRNLNQIYKRVLTKLLLGRDHT